MNWIPIEQVTPEDDVEYLAHLKTGSVILVEHFWFERKGGFAPWKDETWAYFDNEITHVIKLADVAKPEVAR